MAEKSNMEKFQESNRKAFHDKKSAWEALTDEASRMSKKASDLLNAKDNDEEKKKKD